MTARALTEGEGGSAKCISKRSSAGDIRFDQEGLHPDTLISNAAPQFWPRKDTRGGRCWTTVGNQGRGQSILISKLCCRAIFLSTHFNRYLRVQMM